MELSQVLELSKRLQVESVRVEWQTEGVRCNDFQSLELFGKQLVATIVRKIEAVRFQGAKRRQSFWVENFVQRPEHLPANPNGRNIETRQVRHQTGRREQVLNGRDGRSEVSHVVVVMNDSKGHNSNRRRQRKNTSDAGDGAFGFSAPTQSNYDSTEFWKGQLKIPCRYLARATEAYLKRLEACHVPEKRKDIFQANNRRFCDGPLSVLLKQKLR